MSTWDQALANEKKATYFLNLCARVQQEREAGKVIYPASHQVFDALKLTELHEVKVVILGQDPYHGHAQANGLSFSVSKYVSIPPSLRNIFKELSEDIPNFVTPSHGDLSAWSEQGVLLLNTVLTVEEGKAHSHASWGWETFTNAIISTVSEYNSHVVFLLWGSHAQQKRKQIDVKKHSILTAPHPSPLSAYRGFFGCRHFSKTNEILAAKGSRPIIWQV